jgi:hypothetical protein
VPTRKAQPRTPTPEARQDEDRDARATRNGRPGRPRRRRRLGILRPTARLYFPSLSLSFTLRAVLWLHCPLAATLHFTPAAGTRALWLCLWLCSFPFRLSLGSIARVLSSYLRAAPPPTCDLSALVCECEPSRCPVL